MNNILELSIKEIHELYLNGTINPSDVLKLVFEKIEENKELNMFITLNKTNALEYALKLDAMEVEKDNLLWGIPIAIKDNISTKGLRTTCASFMLDNYIPIYDATVIKEIKNHKMIIIGKTNMDEFAMGSTSRTSYYGAPLNPVNKEMITGGSSGGSAAAIKSGVVPLSIGTDTGGSIRQPASYCGIVGMKPTYGSISRFGLIAFASSLDTIGPMSRNVYENALLLNALVSFDKNDYTSLNREKEDFTRLIGKDIKGLKVAVPKYYVSDIVSEEIVSSVNNVINILKENGAIVDLIDMKYLDQAVTLYQVIAMSEASSNLARFDGVKYGYRATDYSNLEEMYCNSRSLAFGDEVKRRIMVGSFILSGDNAKIYYEKALKVRNSLAKEFERVFASYDFIIGPTTTTVAYKVDTDLNDPRKTFMDDVLVIPMNMAGIPSLNIPIGVNNSNLPIGLNITSNKYKEANIYQLGSFIEKKLGDKNV